MWSGCRSVPLVAVGPLEGAEDLAAALLAGISLLLGRENDEDDGSLRPDNGQAS